MLIAVIQYWVFAALSTALFALELWAFANAARFRPDAYIAAGKRTKPQWMLFTGIAALLGLIASPFAPGGGGSSLLLMMIGTVVAGVFLADVLPALRAVMARSSGNRRW